MNTIKIYDENNEIKEYKVLLIIDKEYKYIVYTDIDNNDFNKDLMVAKVKSLDNVNETIQIDEKEWEMIEDYYKKAISEPQE